MARFDVTVTLQETQKIKQKLKKKNEGYDRLSVKTNYSNSTKIRLIKFGSSTGVKPTVSALALQVKTSVTYKGNKTLSEDDR